MKITTPTFLFLLCASIVLSIILPASSVSAAESVIGSSVEPCTGPYQGKKVSKEELAEIFTAHQRWAKNQWHGTSHPDAKRANLCGAELNSVNLKGAFLDGLLMQGAFLENAKLQGARLWDAQFQGTQMIAAQLQGADLSNAQLQGAKLWDAQLQGAKLLWAQLQGALMQKANLQEADLWKAQLQGADLNGANFKKARLVDAVLPRGRELEHDESYLEGADFSDADISGVDVREVEFSLKPGGIPLISSFGRVENLVELGYPKSPHSLVEIRNGLKQVGMREQERILTYVIKHGETEAKRKAGEWEGTLLYYLFEFTCEWGMAPWKPLKIILKLILIFWLPYSLVVAFSKQEGMRGNRREGIWVIRPEKNLRDPKDRDLDIWECVSPTFFFPKLHRPFSMSHLWWLWGIPSRIISTLFAGLYFSVLSAFHIGWRDLNVGNWISRLQPRDYSLRATGMVKFVSSFQSLISVYLLALWVLTYFARPFD